MSLPPKPQRKSSSVILQRGLIHCWCWDFRGCIGNNFTNTTVEPRFFMRMSNEVRLEELDWEKQTSMWSLLFVRNEHNLFPLSNVCICQSVWQCNCLCFYQYNCIWTRFPCTWRGGWIQALKKVQWPKDVWLPCENLNVSSQEVFSFGDLMQCRGTDLCFQSMELDVPIDFCVELPWVLSPHSILPSFFPLLPVHCHAAWTLFSHWKGSFCLLFWDGFSEWLSIYFFSQALNLFK